MGGRGSTSISTRESSSQSAVLNRDMKEQLKDKMYVSHIGNYKHGFNRTANKNNKAGYNEVFGSLMKQVANNDLNTSKRMLERAKNDYENEIVDLQNKMFKAKDKDINSYSIKIDKTYGKLSAVNFINWSLKGSKK